MKIVQVRNGMRWINYYYFLFFTIPLKARLNFEQYNLLLCLLPLNIQNEKHSPAQFPKKIKHAHNIVILNYCIIGNF